LTQKHSFSSAKIAIVGLAFRFPGGITNETLFWEALKNGKQCITEIPSNRWATDTLVHKNRAEPGRSVSFSAGILADIDLFDAGFFGISPREAHWLDPQQRLLLEMAYEAMENGGTPSKSLAGTSCGVYVGISSIDYGLYGLEDLASMSAHSMTGNTLSVAANRLSYVFDLHGPSIAIDTACSSSLVALHYACQALRSGEISTALVGGINILMHPYSFVGFSKASMLGTHGQCLPFDARGQGYVRSEGGAVFVLKPLAKAMADKDNIRAVILASGVNVDGRRKTGITIPSVDGQIELMEQVLAQSGITKVDFVEAHGTGTAVGDPIEARAIGAVYGQKRDTVLPITSVKGNLGHLEPASGMAGLVKAILSLKHRALPPVPFDFIPNEHIDFTALNIHCYPDYTPLTSKNNEGLIAGVNSFGFGGANAHVLVQEYLPSGVDRTVPALGVALSDEPILPPLFLSAQSTQALRDLAGRYGEIISSKTPGDYYDLAYGAALYRDHLDLRLAVQYLSPEKTAKALFAYALGHESKEVFEQEALSKSGDIAFVYAGNGAQWVTMGQGLVQESPLFSRVLHDLDSRMLAHTGFSVLEALANNDASFLEDTSVSQPLIFAIQVGLTQVLYDKGIRPRAVMGHSVGEIAAAWASGALTLDQAIYLICVRSQAQHLTAGCGRMAAVSLSELEAKKLLHALGLTDTVAIAGINAPEQVTLSGSLEHLTRIQEVLESERIFFRLLDLDYAFHSRSMDSIKDILLEKLKDFCPKPCDQAEFISTVTGKVYKGDELNALYWWENVRHPVQFAMAMETLLERGCNIFLEISPHAILQRYIKDCAKEAQKQVVVLPTLLRTNDSCLALNEAILRAHMALDNTKIQTFFPVPGKRVPLPTYPWQKERYWVTRTTEGPWEKKCIHPLLGWPLDGGGLTFENVLDPEVLPWLADHKVDGVIVFPGAAYVEMALAAGQWWRTEGAFSLEYLDIVAPLIFDDQAQTLRLHLESKDGSLTITSRPRLKDIPWTVHATGRILTSIAPNNGPQISKVQEGRTMDACTLYEQSQTFGLDYGPFFRCVKQLVCADHILHGALDLNKSMDGYVLPPALLDACFHSLVALYATGKEIRPTAYLPVKTGRVSVFSQGRIASIRVQLLAQNQRYITFDAELLDASSNLVARASRCQLRAVPRAHRDKSTSCAWQTTLFLKPHPVVESVVSFPDTSKLKALVLEEQKPWIKERIVWMQETLPLLEALALSLGLQALTTLDKKHPHSWLAHDNPCAAWLVQILEQEHLIVDQDGVFCVAQGVDLPDPFHLWQNIFHEHPNALRQLLAIGRAGLSLSQILTHDRQETDTGQNRSEAPVAKALATSDPAYQGTDISITALLGQLAKVLPPERRLRVLELCMYPKNRVKTLTACLAADSFTYVLACPDQETLEMELLRYKHLDNVSGMVLDVHNWVVNDTRSLVESFDVLLVDHILHQTGHVHGALEQIFSWLVPGGLVVCAERYPDWSACLAQGLDPCWWQHNGQVPLLGPSDWMAIFEHKGFVQGSIIPEPGAHNLRLGTYVLLAKKPDLHTVRDDLETKSWIILADTHSLALAKALEHVFLARNQDVFIHEDMPTHFKADHVVFMRGAAEETLTACAPVNEFLHCVRQAKREDTTPRFWVMTQGGALVSSLPQDYTPSPSQSALWGAARVVMNEYPEFGCTLIDISTSMPLDLATQKLEMELLFPDGADEILLSVTKRQVLLLQAMKQQELVTDGKERYRLDFTAPGQIRNLGWVKDSQKPLQSGEIEARTRAVGLNFRDIMLATGLLPEDAVENGFAGSRLGLEFSGVVTAVGQGVEHLSPGDNIVGFAPASFASHVVTPAYAVVKLPHTWSHTEAATIPTVFFTAYYALQHLAQVQPGERILVHGAAGGVGLATIQLARYFDLEIFATAGSTEKRDLLRLHGVNHIFDSRSLAFADEILTITDGQGVDVVLNSLTGEAMRLSLALLRPFGRFLELGKRDFIENTTLGVRPLKDNISYFAIDADQLLTARPKLATKLFHDLMELFRDQVLTPLPQRIFSAVDVHHAFRAMQKALHMGKIVVTMDEEVPLAAQSDVHKSWVTTGTWLVTGGLDGFGLATARWLATKGATELVLVGRRGLDTPGAQDIIQEFVAQGVALHVRALDVTDLEAVGELMEFIQKNCHPLLGLVHAATVYDDQLIKNLDASKLDKVLAPKVQGAWNLHQATSGWPLEYFILYSSVSVALGNPGQGNYVAANAGLEGLTLLRQHMNLPATCVAWGPMEDVGFLTRHREVQKSLEYSLGSLAFTSSVALEHLGRILSESRTMLTLAKVDWDQVRRVLPHPDASRFEQVFQVGSGLEDKLTGLEDMRMLLRDKTKEEAHDLVCTILMSEVAQVLGMPMERIVQTSSLQSLGMDSLMAVELVVGLEERFGVRIPALTLQDAPNLKTVALRILERLTKEEAPSQAQELARQHGVELSSADMNTIENKMSV